MMRRLTDGLFFHLAAVLVVSISTARSQDDQPGVTVRDVLVDFAVPNVSAGALLDLESTQIIRAGSIRDIAVQLMNLSGANGGTLPAAAIEFNPVMLALKDRSVGDLSPLLQGINLSLGFETTDARERLALGVKWTFVDDNSVSRDNELVQALTGLNNDLYAVFSQSYSYTQSLDREFEVEIQRLAATYDLNSDEVRDLKVAAAKIKDSLIQRMEVVRPNAAASPQEMLRHYQAIQIESVVAEAKSKARNIIDSVVSLQQKHIEFGPSLWEAVGHHLTLYVSSQQGILGSEALHEIEMRVENARERYLDTTWNRLALAIGYGLVGSAAAGTDSVDRTLAIDRHHLYLTGAVPLGGVGQFNVQAASALGTTATDTLQASATHRGMVQLLIGTNSVRAVLDGNYAYQQYADVYFDEELRGSSGYLADVRVGGEVEIATGIWFSATIGAQWSTQVPDGTMKIDYGVKYSPSTGKGSLPALRE